MDAQRRAWWSLPFPSAVLGGLGLALISAFFASTADSQTVVAVEEWVEAYDSPCSTYDAARGLALDSAGNVYVLAYHGCTVERGALVKYDTNGNLQWAVYTPYELNAVTVDASDNVYVTGGGGDLVTSKYTPAGTEIWTDVYDTVVPEGDPHYETGTEIGLDGMGNVYVAGLARIRPDPGLYNRDEDYLTAKYDAATGSRTWVHSYDRLVSTQHMNDTPNDLAIDGAGSVIVTGLSGVELYYSGATYLTIKYDAAGNLLWTSTYASPICCTTPNYNEGFAVDVDSSGDVYVTGQSGPAPGYYDAATVKYAGATGAEVWAVRYDSGTCNDAAHDILVDGLGDVYVAAQGCSAYRTIKYDSDGVEQWVASYSIDNQGETVEGIAQDSSGNVYVTGGSIDLTGGTSWDYATLAYDSDGNELWSARYSGPSSAQQEIALFVAVDAGQNVYVTGNSPDAAGVTDVVTIKYSQETCTPEVCDGLDNDCNGQVDDGIADQQTGTDVGECQVEIQSCIGGAWQVVQPGVGPSPEVCDALDNDCNALVDDGVPDQQTGTDVGECQVEIQSCIGGTYQVTQPGIGPTSEICDGLDNDCEGTVDNGIPDLVTGTDVGACQVEIQSCIGGSYQVTQPGIGPTTEICDGLDNDCNGVDDVNQGICNTPPSSGSVEFTDSSGNASIEFPDVSVGGDTTVQEIACSVNVPDGYTLNTSALCYEIQSTADSSTGRKTVCITYPIDVPPPAPTAILKCESAGAQNCCAVSLDGTSTSCTDGTYFLSNQSVIPPDPPVDRRVCISVTTLSDFAFAALDAGLDSDFDSVPDVSDNCPSTFNPLQEDGDTDGIGDLCDNCAMSPNGPGGGTCTAGDDATLGLGCATDVDCGTGGFCSGAQQDANTDGVGDACDPTLVPFYAADLFVTPDCYFQGGCTPADFPVDWGVVRTFEYGVPPGDPITDVRIQGTWGNDVFGGSAPAQLFLEGFPVAECLTGQPCWDNASTTDWNGGAGYLLSELGVDFSNPAVQALFADGSADLTAIQNDEISTNVSNLKLTLYLPEPSLALGLGAGVIALFGLARLRSRRKG